MADEDQVGDDAAAEAFEELRAEVTLLRRAVERLAAERAELPQPKDYDETLGRIAKAINTLAERMDVLADRPGISITPEGIARQVAAAASTVRAEDQRTIAAAGKSLEDATRALHGYVVTARRGDEQNRWLAWTAIGGVALGIFLWAVFAGAVARTVPESWLWPERMAARTLRLDTWTAARRLASVSQPETWNAMVRGSVLIEDNRAAIERCRRAAARTREAVPCTLQVAAGEERPTRPAE
ncbi:MAG: hypothetical protein DI537_42445 [Stutzerimonas stutzeri]|nr:MAG: hypothetical protein DI537_42445 [Stutzerimonas stutzeri]